MHALMLSYSLSGAAGLRAPLTLLIMSLAVHLGYLHPGPSMTWLGDTWVIAVAAVVTLIDFIGDKLPGVDHVLHSLHTLLAPLIGALAAMTGYNGDSPLEALPAILGAGNAFLVHTARSGARLASTGTTAGVGNTFLSIVEDCVAFILIVVTFLAPVLASVALLLFTIWALKWIRRLLTRRPANPADGHAR